MWAVKIGSMPKPIRVRLRTSDRAVGWHATKGRNVFLHGLVELIVYDKDVFDRLAELAGEHGRDGVWLELNVVDIEARDGKQDSPCR